MLEKQVQIITPIAVSALLSEDFPIRGIEHSASRYTSGCISLGMEELNTLSFALLAWKEVTMCGFRNTNSINGVLFTYFILPVSEICNAWKQQNLHGETTDYADP